MDVKDYSQKLDLARDKYRQAQDDLRSSYDRSTDNLKETFDNKSAKQSKNYDSQKAKLEETNQINNQLYSDKTRETIAERQDKFRNDIKKNSEKFDIDRIGMKNDFNDKLSNLSESYKKSTVENDRFHDQATKTMGERYNKANQVYKSDFDNQIEKLNNKTTEQFSSIKAETKRDARIQDKNNHDELENLRSSSQEQKFKEVARLRDDNENLRTNFVQERNAINEQKEARINDVLKLKNIESEEGQKNFENLQSNIREKNIAQEERVKLGHQEESKALEKKFGEDLRNMQHLTNQKIKGGTEVSSLKDENKQLVTSYENRLTSTRDSAQKNMDASVEKEDLIDNNFREKLKEVKTNNIDALDSLTEKLTGQHKENLQEIKDKNSSLIDRYKNEVSMTKSDSEDKLNKEGNKSRGQLKEQRVEFGKFINNVNNKKMEEISSIKSEFTKDKSDFIEKSKKDYSEEKYGMKEDFNRQINVKEDLYERKLAEMEKQTNKIIDNYENRIGQIARKAEKEVDTLKANDLERKSKEALALKISADSQHRAHNVDLNNMRSRYEQMIGKDRAINEQQTTTIVQKYEDQLERERSTHQKEISMKLSESQAQFERLFKSSEAEKEALRSQYEQRMEGLKNSQSLGNSKKA